MTTYLNTMLHEGKCEITFTKIDGTERVMLCTLNEEYIKMNEVKREKTTDRVHKPKDDILVVFDMEKNDWRSIKTDNITTFLAYGTMEDLIEEV